jgi:hypothetical protein
MREALERARLRGEVRSGLDVELVLDMLTGPFYYRTLFGHAPVTREMTRLVVDYVLLLIAPYVPQKKKPSVQAPKRVKRVGLPARRVGIP